MIILATGVNTLEEYLAAQAELRISRPEQCPRCSRNAAFRRHTGYWRKVIEGQVIADVWIQRFLCRSCGLTVSTLFPFVLPYRRFSAQVVSQALESVATTDVTYRAQSCELSYLSPPGHEPPINDDEAVRPAASQVFRWVNVAVCKSEGLLLKVQTELLLRGRSAEMSANCPNAARARSEEKKLGLRHLASLAASAASLVGVRAELIRRLHAYFLFEAESREFLLTGTTHKASLQQSLQHVIF